MRPGTPPVRLARVVPICTALFLLTGAAVGWVLIAPTASNEDTEPTPSYDVTEVQQRDLRIGTTLTGRWGYGPERPIAVRASGTVTWLPPIGTRAELGDVLMRVDNHPIVLMYGDTPAYRSMDDGSRAGGKEDPGPATATGTDGLVGTPTTTPTEAPASEGPDVEQLERGLSQLGYTGFSVDEEFTAGTAAAVRAWQTDLDVTATGSVGLGDIVFLPEPVRLHPSPDSLGRGVTETSVLQSGTTRLVTAETDDSSWAEEGVRVKVTLPNQRTASGRVVSAGWPEGDSDTGQAGTKQVTIRLMKDHPGVAPGPVKITYIAARRRDVLTVPVTALVALAEGGYAVELADGGFVGVEPGLYAEGVVEVTGDIEAGTQVRVPR